VRQERLAVKLTIDVETTFEFDDELLEIHAAEIVRRALGYEITTSARTDGGIRLLGIFEGVDARLVRKVGA
jgi:hypothetical protein